MRLASWNVNSVTARGDRLEAWLDRHEPDILCIQELKGTEDRFPFEIVGDLGYDAAVFGQKTYNGVAILARQVPEDVRRGLDDGGEESDARLISARLFGWRVINVYVPNGQTVDSDKFAYKLQWLDRLRAYLERHHSPDEPLILCGDFNCAPEDRDIKNPELWRDTVITDSRVRDAVAALRAWGLEDTFRKHESTGGFFSFWDYRQLAFSRNDGLRIDFVLATAPLLAACTGAWIDREERKGHKPSDHAPVVADFA